MIYGNSSKLYLKNSNMEGMPMAPLTPSNNTLQEGTVESFDAKKNLLTLQVGQTRKICEITGKALDYSRDLSPGMVVRFRQNARKQITALYHDPVAPAFAEGSITPPVQKTPAPTPPASSVPRRRRSR